MRVVVALGGNALLVRGERPDASIQREHLRAAAAGLARLAREHEVVIVHGNGPQVGMLARETQEDRSLSVPYPLGDLVAESQGLIGSWIQQELFNAGCSTVVPLVTQVAVDAADPAFAAPSKPIGAVYDEPTAHRLAAEGGWQVRPDGTGWRRVVASPKPIEVLGLEVAERLVVTGSTVVLAGGGGVPVVRTGDGLAPVEAVVDKDAVAALVADRLAATLLVILTDVPGVMTGYATPAASLVRHASPAELRGLDLPSGSMGPKAEACAAFVEGFRGRRAVIGALDDLPDLVAGRAGTQVAAHQHALVPTY